MELAYSEEEQTKKVNAFDTVVLMVRVENFPDMCFPIKFVWSGRLNAKVGQKC